MNLSEFKETIKNPVNRPAVVVVTILVITIFAVVVGKFSKSLNNNNGYKTQYSVHPDEFFNTTPRLKSNEKIIVIIRGDETLKITQKLNSKGEVIAEEEEKISEGEVRRRNEYLRSGEELQDGDILGEEIVPDGKGGFYRKKRILQNGEILEVKEPLENGDSSVEYVNARDIRDLKEILSRDKVVNGKRYTTKKFVDPDGNVITRSFDENGKPIPEGTIVNDRTILDPDTNRLVRVTDKVIGGEVVTERKDLRETNGDDEVKLEDGLFYFKKNKRTGLTATDEIEISRKQDKRLESSGAFVIVGSEADRKLAKANSKNTRDYSVLDRDVNYNEQEIARTTPSYPVDLTRVITVDKIIPAVLINEIKSDIPSKTVRAQIEEDVYGAHGRKILIPKGSKAIGEFKQIEDKAARRMFVAWYRIITPNGINIKLESELTDAQGVSGLEGDVDNRFVDRYGLAFLTSTLNAAAQLSVPINDLRWRGAANAYTDQLAPLSAQLIRENLKVMPTITIPQGTRINISPLQDIWFKEPRGKQLIVEGVKDV